MAYKDKRKYRICQIWPIIHILQLGKTEIYPFKSTRPSCKVRELQGEVYFKKEGKKYIQAKQERKGQKVLQLRLFPREKCERQPSQHAPNSRRSKKKKKIISCTQLYMQLVQITRCVNTDLPSVSCLILISSTTTTVKPYELF